MKTMAMNMLSVILLALLLVMEQGFVQSQGGTPRPRPPIPSPSPPAEGTTIVPNATRAAPLPPSPGPLPTDRCSNEDEHFCGNIAGAPYCIPADWVCDSEENCPDGSIYSDEEPVLCTGCKADEFSCADGTCFPKYFLCDRKDDCSVGEDELNCTYPACNPGFWACSDERHCITKPAKCDGKLDCGDSSDEAPLLCEDPASACSSSKGLFYCNNTKCINTELVCSGSDDCGDNSDEVGCRINECAKNTNPCQLKDTCVNLNIGYKCSCGPGYKLNADGNTCDDIDECKTTPYNCTQLCTNTEGSYKCSCADGYKLNKDNKTCFHSDDIEPYIIFANRYQIRTMTLDGNLTGTISERHEYVHVLDYDIVDEKIYYADAAKEQIISVNFDGTNETIIVRRSIKLVEGLAVDWVTKKIYWTDSGRSGVFVSNVNGSYQKTLHSARTMRPRPIVIYPLLGYLYWADWKLGAFIARMGMDGSNMTKIIEHSLFWPNALTIDYITNTLWFADAHLDKIEMVNLDGSGRYSPVSGVAHVYGINIWENTIYWTDWNIKKIQAANRFTGQNNRTLVNTTYQPYDIHIVHPLRQNSSIKNPCAPNNGGCSHLCLLAPGPNSYEPSYTCQCPDSFKLVNSTTCIADCHPKAEFTCTKNGDDKCIPKRHVCDGSMDCKGGEDEENCPPRTCDPGDFQCKSGSDCVRNPRDLCDEVEDCSDASDEDPAMCANMTCLPDEIQCSTGRCLPGSWECDGEEDCPKGEDEGPKCEVPQNCTEDQFACNNGKCIPELWYCDFDDDCGDRSDEPNGTACHKDCLFGWRKCATNYRCIPTLMFCDGDDDCRDNSDEDPDKCPTCDHGEFECGDKQCIPLRWKCDFEDDCSDGSDEICKPEDYPKCEENEWRCKGDKPKCIRERYKCDHDDDCPNGSDELNCHNNTCHEDLMQCLSGHCYDPTLHCDGVKHCLDDASDEMGCPTRYPGGRYCLEDKFTCNNTVCINLDWRCDGEDDCGDNSDENLNMCKAMDCPITRFRCNIGYCISQVKLCDGNNDCKDGSDENDHALCPPIVKTCPSSQYKCKNGKCIENEKVCNTINDCGDFSDEKPCHPMSQGSCTDADNGGCEGNCTTASLGSKYYCSCPNGRQISPDDKKMCIDFDECAEWGNDCDQTCINSDGSFYCDCKEGFARLLHGSVVLCEANEGAPTTVLIALQNEIRQYERKSGKYTDVTTSATLIRAMDVDAFSNVVYWTDPIRKTVIRSFVPREGGDMAIPQLLQFNSYDILPEGIAFDWIAKNIYVTDSAQGKIVVAKADGRYATTIIQPSIRRPFRIALAPLNGTMVWVDVVNKKIESAQMDGSDIKTLVSSDLIEPTAIAIDHNMGSRIFWSDYKKNAIESANLDGSNRVTVFAKGVHHPFAMDVFETYLYWISQENGTLSVLDKFGRGVDVHTSVKKNLFHPQDVVVMQVLKQPKAQNPCDQMSCYPMCVLTKTGGKCLCPDGDKFQSGSSTQCNTESQTELKEAGVCTCNNGGTCYVEPTSYESRCICKQGFRGSTCNIAITTPTTPASTTTRKPRPRPSSTGSTKATSTTTKEPNVIGDKSRRSDGGKIVGVVVPIVVIILILLIVTAIVLVLLYRKGKIGNKKSAHGVFRPGAPGTLENGNSPNGQYESPAVHYDPTDGGNASFVNPVYDVADPVKEKEKLPNAEYAEIGYPKSSDRL